METFFEWLARLDEESRQEREAREREAAERRNQQDDYYDSEEEYQASKPRPPVGSPEWIAWAKGVPENPRDDFRDSVEEEIWRITGKSWSHGAIIDRMSEDPKQLADDDRIAELIEDSYDDGTSPEETAKMAVELMRSMGYLK